MRRVSKKQSLTFKNAKHDVVVKAEVCKYSAHHVQIEAILNRKFSCESIIGFPLKALVQVWWMLFGLSYFYQPKRYWKVWRIAGSRPITLRLTSCWTRRSFSPSFIQSTAEACSNTWSRRSSETWVGMTAHCVPFFFATLHIFQDTFVIFYA